MKTRTRGVDKAERELQRAPPPDGAGAPAAESATPVAPRTALSARAVRARRQKRLLWTGGGVLVLAVVALLFRPTVLEVETATVVRGPLEATIDAEGMTRVRDRYVVAAPVAGQLQRITLREGDAVEAGAVIARVEPLPLDPQSAAQARARLGAAQAARQEAEARVEQTREATEQAERTAQRMRDVAGAGGLSADALERAELQAAAARRDQEAAVARARAATMEVETARAALIALEPRGGRGVAAVRAPTAGRVLRVADPSERAVQAGAPLLELGDPAGLEVVVDVLSTEAVRIAPGAPMRIVDWGGAGTLPARVRLVEPSGFTKVSALGVEEQRVNVVGELADPPTALGDGYRVEARIVTWSAENALKVPTSALFRDGTEWSVLVIDDGRARLRPVRIGHRGASEAEVVDGLAEGETVILYPSDRVADGVRVRGT